MTIDRDHGDEFALRSHASRIHKIFSLAMNLRSNLQQLIEITPEKTYLGNEKGVSH